MNRFNFVQMITTGQFDAIVTDHIDHLDASLENSFTLKEFSTATLHDYVFGEFTYFMSQFVRYASMDETWIMRGEYSKPMLKRHLLFIFENLEQMKETPKDSLLRRFVAEYVSRIKTNTPVKGTRMIFLKKTVNGHVFAAKRAFNDVPNDPLQAVVRRIVAYLDSKWDDHVPVALGRSMERKARAVAERNALYMELNAAMQTLATKTRLRPISSWDAPPTKMRRL